MGHIGQDILGRTGYVGAGRGQRWAGQCVRDCFRRGNRAWDWHRPSHGDKRRRRDPVQTERGIGQVMPNPHTVYWPWVSGGGWN